MKRLFVVAMYEEAKGIIDALKMFRSTSNIFQTMNGDDTLVITGIGMPRVYQTLIPLLNAQKYDIIVNVGSCGAIKTDSSVGDMIFFNSEESFLGDWDLSAFGDKSKDPLYGKELTKLSLVSYSQFKEVTEDTIPHYADMEYYAIVNIGSIYKIPTVAFKVVSDNGSAEEFDGNITNVMQDGNKIINTIENLLNDWR